METTRQKLINIAFDEIFSHGYQGASLANILSKAGIHKGSLYHFFASKKELALAAMEEKILQKFSERYAYVETYEKGCLEEFFRRLKDTSERDLARGCPIANVVQEMSNVDIDFHTLMKSIYKTFQAHIKTILDKAVQTKELQPCDTSKMALFITSTLEGAILSAKASGEEQDYLDVIEELIKYINQKKR